MVTAPTKKDDVEKVKPEDIPEGTTLREAAAQVAGKKSSSDSQGDFWFEGEETRREEEELQDELNIGDGVDPLEAFLDVDRSVRPTATVRIPRLNTEVTVMAITDSRKHERMVKRCQREYKVRGQRREELDVDKLAKLVVAEYTIWPPFRTGHGLEEDKAFKKMAAKYGTSIPDVLVEKALYPGEIQKLADAIMELAGFDSEREIAKK